MNQSMNDRGRYRAARAAKNIKVTIILHPQYHKNHCHHHYQYCHHHTDDNDDDDDDVHDADE